MGLYDRDYSRGPEPGFQVQSPQTATTQLVIVTFGVYLLQMLFDDNPGPLPVANVHQPVSNLLALSPDWYAAPWNIYRLLTYGFVHSRGDVFHILINMVVLWMFGRDVEYRYGKRAFVAFYLSAIIFAGLVWSLIETAYGGTRPMVGASGGIAGIFALYALNFPHRKVLFMFVIPMPMWVAALIALFLDALGAMDRSGNVAYTAHLAGALYGLYYFKFGWNPGLWVADKLSGFSLKPRPKLRVHAPDDVDDMSQQVDRILAKIQDEGQDSLTRRERKILEKASREYQQRRP